MALAHKRLVCSCGAVIAQCRCIGPHVTVVVPGPCTRCLPKPQLPATDPEGEADMETMRRWREGKWKQVEELAEMSKNIPPERRENSTVRRAVLEDRQETATMRRLRDGAK